MRIKKVHFLAILRKAIKKWLLLRILRNKTPLFKIYTQFFSKNQGGGGFTPPSKINGGCDPSTSPPGLGSSTDDQVLKYTKYWSSTHFFKKYLSTSITFISSTSTSTHIKISHWSLISIPWYIYVVWIKERDFSQIISLF